MSKWFKSSFCSGLTDLAPSPQNSTPCSSPPQGLLTHPFQVIFLSNNASVVCAWDIFFETVNDWARLSHKKPHKRQLPSAVTGPVGFPRSSAARHVATFCWEERELWRFRSFMIIHPFFSGYVRGACEEKMNSDSPSTCLVFNSAALWCDVSWIYKVASDEDEGMLSD